MKKNIIVVTGGAGFVGSNLIEQLIKLKKYEIISLDNYTTGKKKNQIKHKKVTYIKSDTSNINKKLNKFKKRINSIFHFGEFSRIHQSFKMFDECLRSNSFGTKAVFKFCLENKIKLIYSATSASLGNYGNDKNLSPYSFTKSHNLELLENLKKWFNFKYEVIYFYNVYGPKQICEGKMATVIGIFQTQFRKKKPITVVKPGTQTRRFTHIQDTIKVCLDAWKKNKNRHYSISSRKSHSIIEVAKMFKSKVVYIPERLGERYSSSIKNTHLSNFVHKRYGKTDLLKYVSDFLKKNEKI